MTKLKKVASVIGKTILTFAFVAIIASVNARACENANKEIRGCAIDMSFGDETYTPPLSADKNQTIIIGATSADIKNCIANGGKTVSCLRKFLA